MSVRIFVHQSGETVEVEEFPHGLLGGQDMIVSWSVIEDTRHFDSDVTPADVTDLLIRAAHQIGAYACEQTDASCVIVRAWCPHVRDHGMKHYIATLHPDAAERQRMKQTVRGGMRWFADIGIVDAQHAGPSESPGWVPIVGSDVTPL